MMTEISLNVLDVAQNSIKAKATLIEISVKADTKADLLTITIKDNGCGMTSEQVQNVTDPFYTTRKTRKVGFGVSFFKEACELTGGNFKIESNIGIGTIVTAVLKISSIDRMPLGDMTGTMHTLITLNKNLDFLYTYEIDERKFVLDTREFRKILDGVSFDTPEVSTYIKEFLSENKNEIDNDIIL